MRHFLDSKMPRRSASADVFSAPDGVRARRTLSAVHLALTPALLLPALLSDAAEAASDPAPKRSLTQSEAKVAPDIRLAQSQTDAPAQPVDAGLRFGRHDEYDRFAFEWSEPVEVDFSKSGGELVLTFNRAAETTLPQEGVFAYHADRLPQIVFDLRAEDRGRRYRIGIDPNVRFRVHRWNDGRLIVVDIFQQTPAGATTPAADDDNSEDAADRDTDVDRSEDRDEAAVADVSPIIPPVAATEAPTVEANESEVDDGESVDDDEDDTPSDRDDDEDEEEDDDGESEETYTTVGEFELAIGASLQFGLTTAGGDRLSDGEGDRGYAFFTDSDIEIEAFTTFFDDTDAGAVITLEADADVSDESVNADETYLYFDNGFGQVQLGRTTGAEDDMALGADTIAAGTGGIDGDTANLGDTQVDTSGDAAKISYFTPRIGGFQFGASYTPDTGDSEDDSDDDGDLENHVGVGFNFVDTIGDVELSLATVGSFGRSEFAASDDLSAFSVGGTLALEAVELGASIGQTSSDADFDFATVGVTVGVGESDAGVGYNYLDEADGGVTHVVVISGGTPILPGVELQADVSYADPENDDGNVASVLAVEMGF